MPEKINLDEEFIDMAGERLTDFGYAEPDTVDLEDEFAADTINLDEEFGDVAPTALDQAIVNPYRAYMKATTGAGARFMDTLGQWERAFGGRAPLQTEDPSMPAWTTPGLIQRANKGLYNLYQEKVDIPVAHRLPIAEVPGMPGGHTGYQMIKRADELLWNLREQVIGKDASLFEHQQKVLAGLSDDFDKAIVQAGGMNKFAQALCEGAGSASVDLLAMGAMGLPVFMGLSGGAEAIKYGEDVVKASLVGGLEGATMHLAFKWLNRIPRIERVATGGAAFGSVPLYEELQKDPKDRDWPRVFADIMIGMGLSWAGPSGIEFRKAFYKDLLGVMKDKAILLAQKKMMLKQLEKELERDAELSPGAAFRRIAKENEFWELDTEAVQREVDVRALKQRIIEDLWGDALKKRDPDIPFEQAVKELSCSDIPVDVLSGFKSTAEFVEYLRSREPLVEKPEAITELPEFTLKDGTHEALELGQKIVGDEVMIDKLRVKRNELGKQLKETKDLDLMQELAHKKQLYGEALYLAEGATMEGYAYHLGDLYGPKGIGSVALDKDNVALDAWMVEHSVGRAEEASTWLREKAKDAIDPEMRYGFEDAARRIDERLVRDPEAGSGLSQRIERLKREAEDRRKEALTTDEIVRRELDEVPALEDFDPLTGSTLKIPAELLGAYDWLEQNGKRLKSLDKAVAGTEKVFKESRDIFSDLMGHFDIEFPLVKAGAPNTARVLKSLPSIRTVYENEAHHQLKRWYKDIKYDKELDHEFPLILEDPNHLARQRPEVAKVCEEYKSYMERNEQILKDLGGLTLGWKDRVLRDLDSEIMNGTLSPREVDIMRKMRAKVKQTNFVHIPMRMWFEKAMQKRPEVKYDLFRKMIALKTAKKRDTIRIQDLLDADIISKEDIHLRDVVGSYAMRLGSDVAFLELRRDGLAEGMIKDRFKRGFIKAGSHAPIFKDLYLHPTLNYWIDQMTGKHYLQSRLSRGTRKVMSMTKMWQFCNPLYMSYYNCQQSALLTRGKFVGYLPKAFKDAITFSPSWRATGLKALRSQPYSNLFDNYWKGLGRASHPFHKNVLKLRNVFPDRWMQGYYNTVWNITWFLDGVSRQATYHALRSPSVLKIRKEIPSHTEACQMAALAHGDYAKVPPNTRELFNHIFFTPTFKIAMFHLHKEMVKSALKTTTGRGNTKDAAFAKAALTAAAVTYGFHCFMSNYLGLETEDFGFKYRKKVPGQFGQEELIVGMTSPINMWLNEVHRAEGAFSNLHDNAMVAWLRGQKNKLHPAYKLIDNIVKNVDPEGEPKLMYTGEQTHIYKPVDHWTNQWLDRTKYLVKNLFPVLNSFVPSEGEKVTREAMIDATGALFERMSRGFFFRYRRYPVDQRLLHKLEVLDQMFIDQIYEYGGEGAGDVQVEALLNRMKSLEKEFSDYHSETATRNDFD